MKLFESFNIRPMTQVQLDSLATSQTYGYAPPAVKLEEGSLSFNSDTGHIVKWDGTQWVPLPGTDGYTILDSGFWMSKTDLSGPYVYDGTAMKLASHV